jgi:hypothetical protein
MFDCKEQKACSGVLSRDDSKYHPGIKSFSSVARALRQACFVGAYLGIESKNILCWLL